MRQDGADAAVVQLYRIECGPAEQQADAADGSIATGSTSQRKYLFRPRDALEVVSAHEAWQPEELGIMEDKVRLCCALHEGPTAKQHAWSTCGGYTTSSNTTADDAG
jgi:hypothetical protein